MARQFYDTGLLCRLLGIQEPSQLAAHPLRGAIFETLIISELMKARVNRLENASFCFWRDSNGNEIALTIDYGSILMTIEIKSGKTLNRIFFSGMERWTAMAGDNASAPTLIYGWGENTFRRGIRVLSWNYPETALEHSGKANSLYSLENSRSDGLVKTFLIKK